MEYGFVKGKNGALGDKIVKTLRCALRAALFIAVFVASVAGCSTGGWKGQNPTLPPPLPEDCLRHLVMVEAVGAGYGSGIKIGPNRIITAYHVVKDSNLISADGLPCTLAGFDAAMDLAVLTVTGGEFNEAFNDASIATIVGGEPPTGTPVVHVGWPSGNRTVSVGTITGYRFVHSEWFDYSAFGWFGSSGGGVFAIHGDRYVLVGITVRIVLVNGAPQADQLIAVRLSVIRNFLGLP